MSRFGIYLHDLGYLAVQCVCHVETESEAEKITDNLNYVF